MEIDGAFAFGVSEALLAQEGLFKGKELSLEQVGFLRQASKEDKLYEKALGFLSYRPRSQKEVELYLRKKVEQGDIIETVLTRLENQGYLNDTSFARWWVEQRTQGKNPKGPAVVKAELYQKGVAHPVVEEVLGEVKMGGDLVKKAALSRSSRLKGLDKVTFKRRLSTYLLRRGFLWEQVKPVVDELAN